MPLHTVFYKSSICFLQNLLWLVEIYLYLHWIASNLTDVQIINCTQAKLIDKICDIKYIVDNRFKIPYRYSEDNGRK